MQPGDNIRVLNCYRLTKYPEREEGGRPSFPHVGSPSDRLHRGRNLRQASGRNHIIGTVWPILPTRAGHPGKMITPLAVGAAQGF